jgi:uncharacterized protein YndB with AHSA1/START domain
MTHLQRIVDAISSPIRREILWLVWERERAAGDIAAAFDVTAPTISSHLTVLRDAGLVVMRSDRNFRLYRAVEDAVARVRPLLASEDTRWQAADDIPEQQRATATTKRVVEVSVELAVPPEEIFDAFTDGDRYSAWMGVPVRLRDNEFACTLEWGTEVRGRYDVVVRPELIAMRWDFDDQSIPVPGEMLVGYLRFNPTETGCRVVVHQLVNDASQAEFMTVAWALVLGRLEQHYTEPGSSPPKPARPKRRRPQ